MAELKVTYDRQANAAYIYFVAPGDPAKSAYMYACDEDAVDGMINLDFGESGQLVGIEVLDARTKLPQYLLDSAEQLS